MSPGGWSSEESAITVEVLVLGPLGVLDDEEIEPIRSAKQRVLLAHLALADGAPVNERLLAEELWEEPPADPRHALQAHVSRLRQTTALPIEHTAGGYRLDTRRVETDAARFEDLLSRAKAEAGNPETVLTLLTEATTLWRGSALENLPSTPGLHGERNRLHLLYDQAVTDLVDAHLAAGRPADALPLLYAAVERNPVDERRWEQLMIALDASGQREKALDAYARARGELVDHLGLEPGVPLRQLHSEILNGTRPTGHRPTEPVFGGSPPPDVVGREREWEALTRLGREARTHQRVAVLSGEPGIGKTYLASRFASALQVVHASRCQATRAVPYGSLAELIRSDCAGLSPRQLAERLGPGAEALGGLVPELVARLAPSEHSDPAPDPQVEHHRIERALTDWLRRAGEAGPRCLLIDDLHWADADSLRLIAELWSQPRAFPILWIVTLREYEHLPGSPAATLIDQAVRPSDWLTQISLEGLDRPAVADLVHTAMNAEQDRDLSEGTLEEVIAATAGNPLFVLETARHLAAYGSDTVVVSLPVPPNLATIVEDHVARLDAVGRELLEVAAIVGEEFDPLLVGTAAERDSHELDRFLATAQHLGLLAPVAAGVPRHRFRHALVQAVIVQQIAPMRRARLHLRVARAIRGHPHIPDRLHSLAHHHVQAVSLTGAEEAIGHVLTAAEASLRQRAPAVARELYAQAFDLLTEESPIAQRCEIHLGLGEAGFRAGLDYRDDLLTAARLAHDMGDLDRLVRAAVANNRGWYSSTAEIDRDRVAVIDTALAMLPDDPGTAYQPARSRLLSLWATENVRDPARREDSLRATAESMRIAEDLGDEDLLGEIMSHRFSVLYTTFDDPAFTVEFAHRLDAFAHARIDPELQLNSTIAVAQSSMVLGDFATADRALDRSERLATELAHPARGWLVATWRATRTAMRGDIEAARAQATQAVEMGMAFDQPDAFTWFAGQLFVFHHMSGRLPELIEAVEQQVEALTDQIPAWRAAYALTLAAVDRQEEARSIIDDFRHADFDPLPWDVLYLHGLSYLAEAATAIGYAEAAPDLYEALSPHAGMIANNATIDAGPVDLRLGELAALRGDRAAARRHLDAAEAFCRASQAATWLDFVRKAQARLL